MECLQSAEQAQDQAQFDLLLQRARSEIAAARAIKGGNSEGAINSILRRDISTSGLTTASPQNLNLGQTDNCTES
jgi:hypothetical protein